jgi:purine-binding chemotaxis protein CheW
MTDSRRARDVATADAAPEERAVLEARARALARPPDVADTAATIEVTVFSIAREEYAIESRFLREVLRLADMTPVPGLPEPLAGVTNLRGEILAVFDLRRLFGIASSGIADLPRLIVLGAEHAELGVLVESVREIRRVAERELSPLPLGVGGAVRDLAHGVTLDGTLVLDGERLLADPRLTVEEAE